MIYSRKIYIFTMLSVFLIHSPSFAKIYCDDGCVQFKIVLYPEYLYNQTSRMVIWNEETCMIDEFYHDPRVFTNDTVKYVRLSYDKEGLGLYYNGWISLYLDEADFANLIGILGGGSIPFTEGTYYIDGCEPCLKRKNLKREECGGDQYVDWSSWNYTNCTGRCNCLSTYESLVQLCGEGSIINWDNLECTGDCVPLLKNLGNGGEKGDGYDPDQICQ